MEKAYELVNNYRCDNNQQMWFSLLSGCRNYNNKLMAKTVYYEMKKRFEDSVYMSHNPDLLLFSETHFDVSVFMPYVAFQSVFLYANNSLVAFNIQIFCFIKNYQKLSKTIKNYQKLSQQFFFFNSTEIK